MFYTCLFSGQGVNLRPLLSSASHPENLTERIRLSWSERQNRYSQVRGEPGGTESKIEMYRLGG
jgi:cyclic pyranopterin phosphate synthase